MKEKINEIFDEGKMVKLVGEIKKDEKAINETISNLGISSSKTKEIKEKMIKSIENINKKIKSGLEGRIVDKFSDDLFLISFDFEDDAFQYNIEDVDLGERKYLILEKENLSLIKSDSLFSDLSFAIENKKNKISKNIIIKIKDIDNYLRNDADNCVAYKNTLINLANTMSQRKNLRDSFIKELNKNNEEISYSFTEKQLEKLKNNNKIDSIEYKNHSNNGYILVKTNNLEYKSDRVSYSQGSFVFVINLTNNSINAFGSKYFKTNPHPCINYNGNICFGSDSQKYNDMIVSGSIISLIHKVINFLEEPDYDGPYISDLDTCYSQELKKNKEFDYNILSNYVEKREKFLDIVSNNFDESKYKKELDAKNKKTGNKVIININASNDNDLNESQLNDEEYQGDDDLF